MDFEGALRGGNGCGSRCISPYLLGGMDDDDVAALKQIIGRSGLS